MVRPKDTRMTKWRRSNDRWCESRKEAEDYAKHYRKQGYRVHIEHRPQAKTQWGQYRRSNWLVMIFVPKIYRGRKVETGLLNNEYGMSRGKREALWRKTIKTRPEYAGHSVVRLNKHASIVLGERVVAAKRKRNR